MAREKIDVGEIPSPADLTPAQAMRLLDEAEREASAANKAAALAKARKSALKAVALQALEINELEGVTVTMDDGSKVGYTPYEFKAYRVSDAEAFTAWAAQQDEAYFDTSPKLREQILMDECRRRVDDGEPLPPGVSEYTEQRISRTAKK